MREKRAEKARRLILDGGVVIYPTETAYGIATDATNPKAVAKLYKIKGRAQSKAIPVIVSDIRMAQKYFVICQTAKKLIKIFMPVPSHLS